MKGVVSQRGRADRILICHYWKCFFLELNFSHCQFRWSSLKKKKTGKKSSKSFDSEEKDSRICKMGSGREHRDGLNAAESSDLILKQIA